MSEVTLLNCDQEPIHLPEAIQPHGGLLAFDEAGRLLVRSENAEQLLARDLPFGAGLADLSLPVGLRELVDTALAERISGFEATSPLHLELGTRQFDVISHSLGPVTTIELEHRSLTGAGLAEFPLLAHRAMDRLRRAQTIDELMSFAAVETRRLTGFDRVMGYRFRHDGSGDIVAEARRPDLIAYLGRRYPANDIPAQARRLYTLNTLRLIADVGYQPVRLLSVRDAPLDMSHCVLRSVSPIHIEYLKNMGVGASMSVSIVVNGELWGMLACHHMSAHHVDYGLRMACDVIAQLLASRVQAIDSRERSLLTSRAAAVRVKLAETLVSGDDVISALSEHANDLLSVFDAAALIAVHHDKSLTSGAVSERVAAAIVASLPSRPEGLQLVRSDLAEWPAEQAPLLGPWVGVLGINFDPVGGGWLLLLRQEQLETISWGGQPEKIVTTGPNGPRLTPRGSFELYQETVRGKSVPWSDALLNSARQLGGELARIVTLRGNEVESARRQLMAMLGHDLRDPLQSITMATAILKKGAPGTMVADRLAASSERMRRLITAVMDMSRIEAGIGLNIEKMRTDLAQLARDLIDEARIAYPNVQYEYLGPDQAWVHVDPDRVSQVLGNLLSNARHHGQPGSPIELILAVDPGRTTFAVRNTGAPIPREIESTMFRAFEGQGSSNRRNRTGLGLGLFIASQVVGGHGGRLEYLHEDGKVVFRGTVATADQAESA